MDIRTLVTAGHNLWGSQSTEDGVTVVAVCTPDMATSDTGDSVMVTGIKTDKINMKVTDNSLIPIIKV